MNTAVRKSNYFASSRWSDYRDEVKRRAYGNWDSVLISLAPEHLTPAINKSGRHVACPRHGGKDGYRMYKDYRITGGSVCNTCGPFQDGFATLQWLYGWTFSEAIRAVGDVVGVRHYDDTSTGVSRPKIALIDPPKRKTAEEVNREDEAKGRRQSEVWSGAMSLMAPEAEIGRAYLRNRGITAAVGPLDDLRFHPGLPYFENKVNLGNLPALVCLMRQPNGNPTTLQRIFLSPEGYKADLEHPKKIMPYRSTSQYAGSAVRLDHQVGSILCITEGVETGMAWRAMLGLPTWSTCVAGLMEEVMVPESVKIVVAAGDRDRPSEGYDSGRGIRAAEMLVQRVRKSGRKAAVILPPYEIGENQKSVDWNDVVEMHGLEGAQQQPFVAAVRNELATMLEGMGLDWESAHAHY